MLQLALYPKKKKEREKKKLNKICDENCFECKFKDCVLPDTYIFGSYTARKEIVKKRYLSLKERGICTTCGKNKVERNKVTCKECCERKRRNYYERKNKSSVTL